MTVLGDQVRERREKLGMSQQALADAVGISQTAIAKIEAGQTLRSRYEAAIARALQAEPGALSEGQSTAVKRPTPNASTPAVYQPFTVGAEVPVFGKAAAGNDGRFIMNGQKIASVFAPPVLNGVDGAYAVYVFGDSMEPKFEPGETVWLHPYLPVRKGDYVVVQIAGDDEAEPLTGFVKQFVSRSGGELVLRQLNPPTGEDEMIRLPVSKVFSVHKVVFSQLV